MSADAWSVCPTCRAEASRATVERAARAAEAYGKLPPGEWKALDAATLYPVDARETFREDWEIGLFGDDHVTIIYRGSCSTCGALAEFRAEVPVTPGDARKAAAALGS